MTTSEHTADQRRPGAIVWLLLAAILMSGFLLRQTGLRGSLWLDELHTAWVVSGSFEEVAPRAMIGNQPPLPYWLLWGYVQLVGVSEWSLRLPSLLASTASLFLVYVLVRRWTGCAVAGLVAAAALAVESHSAGFYASEARVYALVQCLALVQLLAFERALRTGGRWERLATVLLAWLLFYTHYTAALLVAAEVVTWLVLRCLRFQPAYSGRHAALDAFAFALGCLPALPHLREIAARRENWEWFIPRPTLEDVIHTLPHQQMLLMLALVWALTIAVGWAIHRRSVVRRLEAPVVILSCAWLLVPLATAWLLAQFDIARLFYLRYLVYLLPAGGVLVGLLTALIAGRALRLAFAVLTVILLGSWNLWMLAPVLQGTPLRHEDWRAAIAALNARDWQPEEPLFLAPSLIEAEQLRTSNDPALRAFCLFPLHAAYPLEAPGIAEQPLPFRSPGRITDRQARQIVAWLAEHQAVLFLVRGTEAHARRVAADVERALPAGHAAGHFRGFGDLWLFEIRRAGSP